MEGFQHLKEILGDQFRELDRLLADRYGDPSPALKLLEKGVPRLRRVEKHFDRKFRKVVRGTQRDPEAFLDRLVEARVLLQLIDYGVEELQWEPPVAQGRKADILMKIADRKIYLEIKRIRKSWVETEREVQRRRIEDAISRIDSPFFVTVFLEDDTSKEPRELPADLVQYIQSQIKGLLYKNREEDFRLT